MTYDGVGTIVVPLRRVATGRMLYRLLVLAGLVVAGWLLGGAHASQAARADELPRPLEVVTKASPVLDGAVREAVTPARPIPDVVEHVAKKAAPVRNEVPPPVPVPPRVGRPAAAVVAKTAAAHARPRHVQEHRRAERAVARRYKAPVPHSAEHRVAVRGVQHRPAPLPAAPAQDDQHSTAAGLVVSGGPAGLPCVLSWAPSRPQGSLPRVPGVESPVVRTAADEPSFAPD
ncbi:hypothetical protein [Actinomadura fibrosa]|uniref:Uncharacterized protein n=1 Tax=Actinomadura fibrosa TaxID=111802 RepID=A0ABW2XI38_9ACTN|nr:hypothetical protein [Actinomadura fibrosa]